MHIPFGVFEQEKACPIRSEKVGVDLLMKRFLTRSRTTAVRSLVLAMALIVGTHAAVAATFGTVIPIGGQASDIALDESRKSLYIANFGGNRIDVMSLDTNAITRSIQVTAQPGALALSRDNRFLVVAHYGNFEAARNAVTVINLEDNTRRVFGTGSAPLAIAFTIDNLAFVVTSTEFLLLDPVSGQTRTIDTVEGLAGKTLPVPAPAIPPVIIRASAAVSRDGLWVYGLTDKFLFRYDIGLGQLIITGYTSSPDMGPRTVSVNSNGTFYTAGWALFDRQGTLVAQFPNPSGKLDIGSHAIDTEYRGWCHLCPNDPSRNGYFAGYRHDSKWSGSSGSRRRQPISHRPASTAGKPYWPFYFELLPRSALLRVREWCNCISGRPIDEGRAD
jgi:hypothetical protein